MKADSKITLAAGFAGLVLILVWFQLTPPGLLGKTDAVGYAVCHRISSHSFTLGERPLSLCARCSGQYLGFVLGLVFQLGIGSGRKGGLPGTGFRILAAALGLAYTVDGVNSILILEPATASLSLYQPNNYLRFLTGFGAGLGISLFFLPFWNRLVWEDVSPGPVFRNPGWFGLGGSALLTTGLYLTGNPLILYPLTLAAAAGVLLVLTGAYSAVWVILFRWENQFRSWQDLIGVGALGFTTALIQIAALDWIRFWVTGTWSGFHFG